MPNVLIVGLSGEGDTDRRFFTPIVQRTFTDLLTSGPGQVDCLDPFWVGVAKGADIAEAALRSGREYHLLFCCHADQDRNGYAQTETNQLLAARTILANQTEAYPPLIPILPKEETESWMLCDGDALRRVTFSTQSNADLGLHGNPERYADPKAKLREVLEVINAEPRRYYDVELGPLYEELGTEVSLEQLRGLGSFRRFEAAARAGLVEVGYLVG